MLNPGVGGASGLLQFPTVLPPGLVSASSELSRLGRSVPGYTDGTPPMWNQPPDLGGMMDERPPYKNDRDSIKSHPQERSTTSDQYLERVRVHESWYNFIYCPSQRNIIIMFKLNVFLIVNEIEEIKLEVIHQRRPSKN